MNILIFSKRDLTSTVLLNDLLPRLLALPDCRLRVVLAERTRPVELVVPELIRMKYHERDLPFGTVFPKLDADPTPLPPGRLMTPTQLAARHGIEIVVARAMDDPALLATIAEFAPDLMVSCRFSFLFPPEIIALPRRGIINVHPGRLPDYAGLYPHFFSMLAGEASLGCTIHFVVPGIDNGPVLASGEVPIMAGRSAFAHNLESHLLGNRLLADLILAMMDDRQIEAIPQAEYQLKLNTYPTPAEFERFHASGLSLIEATEYEDLLGRFGRSPV